MELSPRFDEALRLALELHRGQRRKVGGAPYIGHLLRVSATVLEFGGTEDEAIAALLHDSLEDQNRPGLSQEIAAHFGQDVLQIVLGCSDTTVQPKPPWRERKLAFLQRLATANAAVRLVVTADALDNITTLRIQLGALGPKIWEQFRGGPQGTFWYYAQLVQTLQQASDSPLIQELARRLDELQSAVQEGHR